LDEECWTSMAASALPGASRLWRRYLINNSEFVTKLAMQSLKVRSYQLEHSSSGASAEHRIGEQP
jgi:hypothetical protein